MDDTRFILGGAQLGSNYGLLSRNLDAFSRGLESQMTLEMASSLAINRVDTARTYPGSEEAIRDARWSGEVHTKLDKEMDPLESVRESLRALGRNKVEVLYLCHQPSEWAHVTEPAARGMISRLRRYAEKIGVSAYSAQEVLNFVALDEVDVIQIPHNVAVSAPLHILSEWRAAGFELVARSVFLQGLLLEQPKIPTKELRHFIERFRELCRDLGRSPAEAALGWVTFSRVFSHVIIAAESPAQLKQLGTGARRARLSEEEFQALSSLPRMPEEITDPRNWKVQKQ